MVWIATPVNARIFVVWDPYISGPISCTWDGHDIWDSGSSTWDSGASVWGDAVTTWVG